MRNALGQRFDGLRAEILLDTVAPSGSVSIDNGAVATAVSTVVLQLQAVDSGVGVAMVQFAESFGGLDTAVAQPYEATKIWTLGSVGGQAQTTVTVWARFIDDAGNVGAAVSDSIVFDVSPPQSVTFLVDGATPDCVSPPLVNNAVLTLSVFAEDGATGSGVQDMKIAEIGLFDSVNWAPFLETSILPLSTNNGAKTFAVQVRDAAGNVTQSTNGCIVLDTVPPVVQVVSAAGPGAADGYATGSSVAVQFLLVDNQPLSGAPQVCIDGDIAAGNDCLAGIGWQTTTSGQVQATLVSGEGLRTLNVYARDDADNVSLPAVRTIMVDATPPAQVPVVSAVGGLGQIELSWAAVTDADHYLVYYDTADGPISLLDGTGLDQGNSPVAVSGTTLKLTGMPGMMPYFFRVVAVDAAGNTGLDPGRLTTGRSGFIRLPGLTLGAGGGTTLSTGLDAVFDGRGNLWFTFKNNSDAVLVHCIDDCDDLLDIVQMFRPLGLVEPSAAPALAATHDKLLMAYPAVLSNEVLVGVCDQAATGERCDDNTITWDHSSRTADQSFVVHLPVGNAPAVTVPIAMAVDAASTVWLAAGRVDDGGSGQSLRLFRCRLHQGPAPTPRPGHRSL